MSVLITIEEFEDELDALVETNPDEAGLIDALIEGFIRFMDLPRGADGTPGFPGPINLGNPGEFTIRQLAEKVIVLTGAKSKLVFKPLPADDPMQRQPDITRAQEYLGGWTPQVPLEHGLKKTIAYFDQLLTCGD